MPGVLIHGRVVEVHAERYSLADLLNYLGQALTIFGIWLNHATSPIPWPLVIALMFLPLVAVFRTTLWVMRGRTWPVMCKYYRTQQRRADKSCRVLVAGEWHYCRHHKKAKEMSGGYDCDPKLQRWQARSKSGAVIERGDMRGVGFVRLLSNRETMLFHKGIAKRPLDVLSGLRPRLLRERWARGLARVRELRPRDLIERGDASPQGVTSRMPKVVQATRFTLVSVTIQVVA